MHLLFFFCISFYLFIFFMHLQMVLPLSSNLSQPTAPHLATFSAHTHLHASPCAVLSAWKALPLLTHPFKSHCLTCSHELPARQNQSIQCSAPMYLADLYCSSSCITLVSSTKQGLSLIQGWQADCTSTCQL